MFGIEPSEFLLVALVALVVIGPKDLPKAMRMVGYWVGKARGVARQFRSGFDDMVREAELEEMEKRWAKENERIMREHPQPAPDLPAIDHVGAQTPVEEPVVMKALPSGDEPAAATHVEKPVVAPAPLDAATHSSPETVSLQPRDNVSPGPHDGVPS